VRRGKRRRRSIAMVRHQISRRATCERMMSLQLAIFFDSTLRAIVFCWADECIFLPKSKVMTVGRSVAEEQNYWEDQVVAALW